MGEKSWFGSLDLAYKYAIVFGSFLAFTLIVGGIKVLYDRKKIKQHIAKQELEAQMKRDDLQELNSREKDEGDLFGIRAIEAGYYGGVAQSRQGSPVGSRRGSVSSQTLVGSTKAAKAMGSSTTLHMTSAQNTAAPSIVLSRPPSIKTLRPSDAELTGRHNPTAGADMNANGPPSPRMHPRASDGSTSSDDYMQTPEGSPIYAEFTTGNGGARAYRPEPPHLIMNEYGRSPAYQESQEVNSQRASLVGRTPSQRTAPSSPELPPVPVPALPERALMNNAFAQGGQYDRPTTSYSTNVHSQSRAAPPPLQISSPGSIQQTPDSLRQGSTASSNIIPTEEVDRILNDSNAFRASLTSDYSFDFEFEDVEEITPGGHRPAPLRITNRTSKDSVSRKGSFFEDDDDTFGYRNSAPGIAMTAESPKTPPVVTFIRRPSIPAVAT